MAAMGLESNQSNAFRFVEIDSFYRDVTLIVHQ